MVHRSRSGLHSLVKRSKMQPRLIVLAGLIGIVVLIVLFVTQPKSNNTTTEPPTDLNASAPADQHTLNSVAFPFLAGSVLHYLDLTSGRFHSYDVSAKRHRDQNRYPTEPFAVLWSPDGTRALITTSDGERATVTVSNGLSQPLHSQIFAPAWSADSQQILYQFIDRQTGASTLSIAKADGTDWQNLVPTPGPFTGLWWSPIGTYAIGINGTSNDIQYYLIAISSKTIKILAPGSPVGRLQWSPSGKLALLDGKDSGTVNIANIETGKVEPLGATSAAKLLSWESEDSLVGVVTDSTGKPHISRISLKDKKVTTLTDPAGVTAISEVVGLYKNQLLVWQAETLSFVSLVQ